MNTIVWPLWRKIVFRFLFILVSLFQLSWWIAFVPGVDFLQRWYISVDRAVVNWANEKFFHVRPVLVYFNGSGDTSHGWAQLNLYVAVALLGCIIWSLIDRKRSAYTQLNYWLLLFTRYYVAMVAFLYGIIKVFALQMVEPSLSQLATPLGDLLPMRFSWLMIGYSTPYQVFSGIMEVLAGVLLLWRRTATLGVLLAFGVFLNVMMLNLSYDIPVKIFSMQMVFVCLFLLVHEFERLVCFFILNKPATSCSIYQYELPKKWMRVTRVVLKIAFFAFAVAVQVYETWERYNNFHNVKEVKPISPALYDITVFKLGNDSLPIVPGDSLRWRDIVFDRNGAGSVKSADTLFRQRYHRGYFSYATDTVKQLLNFKKFPADTSSYLSFTYELPDDKTILLTGTYRNQPLFLELKRSKHKFQLAEHQFHWLSEANR